MTWTHTTFKKLVVQRRQTNDEIIKIHCYGFCYRGMYSVRWWQRGRKVIHCQVGGVVGKWLRDQLAQREKGRVAADGET